MKVLIVGGGGREHALAWKAAQSSKVERVYVAPGNAGTAREPKAQNVGIEAEDIEALCAFAATQAIDLTIVGPEAPLVAGLVDRFTQAGLRAFGPSQTAAQLEGSKAFSKEFLLRHGIPSAAFASFTDLDEAVAYVRTQTLPIVVKSDGLAAGKGVVVARSGDEAIAAVKSTLGANAPAHAPPRIVIEEWLAGEEASFMCMVDGEHTLALASSQDHKPRDEGDTGPNTGGMGAYSPAPVVTDALHARIMREIIEPTVRGMAAEGSPYTGFLYAGLMITPDGAPKVLEYNCRLGDPEAQPILMRLDGDLVELCEAALARRLDSVTARWDPRPALGVVMASRGYPEAYRKGYPIFGLPEREPPEMKLFHAGTCLEGERIVTDGGRVLCATALGETLVEARARAYGLANPVRWEHMFFRADIGYRALLREDTR